MLYSDAVATIAMIVSITAVPASGYFSYRYAIKGEKRKEFNSVADPLREKLRKQIKLIKQNLVPDGRLVSISDEEFELLIDVTQKRGRAGLAHRIQKYKTSLDTIVSYNDYGDKKMIDPNLIVSEINLLLPYLDRK